MNKLKLLIPTLSVATVATGVFTTTSCSKSDVVNIEITEVQKSPGSDSDNHYFSTAESMTFMRDTKYIVNVDMKKFDVPTFNIGGFALLNKFPVPKDPSHFKWAIFTKPNVWINGKEMLEVTSEDDDGPNTFRLTVDITKEECGICIGKGTKFNDSVFRIEFEVKETIKNFYPMFQSWHVN